MNNFVHKIIFNKIYSYIVKCDCIDWCFCEKNAVKECVFSNNSFQLLEKKNFIYCYI